MRSCTYKTHSFPGFRQMSKKKKSKLGDHDEIQVPVRICIPSYIYPMYLINQKYTHDYRYRSKKQETYAFEPKRKNMKGNIKEEQRKKRYTRKRLHALMENPEVGGHQQYSKRAKFPDPHP